METSKKDSKSGMRSGKTQKSDSGSRGKSDNKSTGSKEKGNH